MASIILILQLSIFLADSNKIVDSVFQAHGGKENWEKVEKLSVQFIQKQHSKFRIDSTLHIIEQELPTSWITKNYDYSSGQSLEMYITDSLCWTQTQFGAKSTIPIEQIDYLRSTAFRYLPQLFLDSTVNIKYLGLQIFKDKQYETIGLKSPEWLYVTKVYVDPDTKIITYSQHGNNNSYTKYSDYRMVENLLIPFYNEFIRDDEIIESVTLKKITIN